MTVRDERIGRRSFLDRLLVAAGIGSSSIILGSAYVVLDGERDTAGAAANGAGHDATGHTGGQMAALAAGPVPSGPVARAFDAALQPAGPERVKRVEMDIVETALEIAGGVTYNAWTFSGSVPGPIVHVRQGDTVDFSLKNSGRTAHSMDFHAAQTPPNRDYKMLLPGESQRYSWQANFPGVFMYHCGTAPMLHHIANGMYGAVVVDPAQPLPPAREFVLVQSEFYASSDTGSNPWQGDLAKMKAVQPDLMAFNGAAFQYKDHPLVVGVGERVRLYVVNAGPTLFSAFHIVGAIFDTVYPDGNPANTLRGVQTYTIAPGGAAAFDLVLPEAGLYPFVTHNFAYTELGAVGLLEAR